MDNFKKGGYRGGGGGYHGGGGDRGGFKGNFRGGRGDDRGERGPVTMHSAVCASCGKPCEVPFRPTGDKPVYCRDCFAGRGAMGGERSQRKDPRTFSNPQSTAPIQSTSGGNGELKKQMEMMNAKMDKLISIVQEVVLKGTLKEVTTESKDTPKAVAPTKIEAKMKKEKKAKK